MQPHSVTCIFMRNEVGCFLQPELPSSLHCLVSDIFTFPSWCWPEPLVLRKCWCFWSKVPLPFVLTELVLISSVWLIMAYHNCVYLSGSLMSSFRASTGTVTCISPQGSLVQESLPILISLSHTFKILFFFGLFRTTLVAYGGSQARVWIGAAASSLRQSHSNMGSKPHLWPTPQLMATPDP